MNTLTCSCQKFDPSFVLRCFACGRGMTADERQSRWDADYAPSAALLVDVIELVDEVPARPPVVDLMAALEASLAAVRVGR